MADWTTIPADTFETDRPVLGSTHLAIVNNFTALAEGGSGAPVLKGTAAAPRPFQDRLDVVTMSASNDFSVSNLHYSGDFTDVSTTSSSYQSAGIITSVLMSGEARFSARQQAEGVNTEAQLRILKNGVVVNTFPLSFSTVTRTIDLSVSAGDTFEWQIRRQSDSDTVTIDQITIRASDAYLRIGLPALGSEL